MKELLVEECLSLKGQIAEIKCKLKLIEREVLENKIPKDQVQSILDYAENGGQNIAPLMQMWASAERIAELDESKPRDAEQIVRRYFELKGVYDTEDEMNEQIDMLRDTKALQSKASKFKEKLLEANSQPPIPMATQSKISQLKTITCIKGNIKKKVKAITPKCPIGYKKK